MYFIWLKFVWLCTVEKCIFKSLLSYICEDKITSNIEKNIFCLKSDYVVLKVYDLIIYVWVKLPLI